MAKACFLVFLFVVGNFTALAKESVTVAIIETLPVSIVTDSREAFEQELTRIMPNHEITFQLYNAQGSEAQAIEILDQMAQQPMPDLILSVATLATRALNASDAFLDVPKLFMAVAAPIEEGIVSEYGEVSARNITGESHVLDAKVKLDMLDGLLRTSSSGTPLRIGLLHSTYPSSTIAVRQLMAIEDQYANIELIDISTPYLEGDGSLEKMTDGIVSALKSQAHQLDGYWLSTGPLVESSRLISRVRRETGLLPLFAEKISTVKDGALLGVVSAPKSIGKSAARKAKRILLQQEVGDIPVVKMDTYTVAVNVSTAIALQLPIPSNYLKLAKNHVYQ